MVSRNKFSSFRGVSMFEYRNRNTPRRTARAGLLATSGLAVLMLAAAQPARAQMAVAAGGSVQVNANTATTATTNTDGANTSSFDQIQLWDNGTAITASTDGTHSITGNGLALEETGGTAAAISMTNAAGSSIGSSSGIGLQMLGNGGGITYSGGGTVSGLTGISASETGSGGVSLTFTGNATGTAGDGIDVSAINGAIVVNNNASTVTIKGSVNGLDASSTGTGTITVEGTGTYTGGTGDGIETIETGAGPGTGNNGILIEGTGKTTTTSGIGIFAQINDATSASNIDITRSGTLTVAAGGGDGILAETNGTGNVTVSGVGSVTAGTGASTIGIFGEAAGGNVLVSSTGSIRGATGIEATTSGSGTVTVTAATSVTGTINNGILTSAVNGATLVTINGGATKSSGTGAGIDSSASGSGNLGVTITAGTVGSGTSTGIELNQTGTGSNTITNSGTITGAGTGANPAIEFATTNSGTTTITNNASRSITNNVGTNGLTILSTVTTGADHITNAGTLTGEISLSNQSNSLTNSGTWSVEDGSSYDAATFGTSGLNTLTNSGTIDAGSTSAAATSTFTGIQIINNSNTIDAGLFGPGDVTTFNAGAFAQTVTNTGTILMNGTLSFVSGGAASNFNNAGGLVDMRNGETTDVTALNVTVTNNTYTPSGATYNFVGGTGSTLGLDTLVGGVSSSGSNVPSDRLVINGTVTGTTAILLNDTGTTGSYNPVGITLVAVNGPSTQAFFLESVTSSLSTDLLQPSRGPMGSIKTGFWFYPLLQTTHATAAADGLTNADSTEYRLYGLPDIEAFQLPFAITGAENIWYDTILGWDDRQDVLRKHWSDVYGTGDAYNDGKFNLWMKATGNFDNRTSADSLNAYTPVPGELSGFDTSFSQDTSSVQFGTDIGFNHMFDRDGVLVLGASMGYVNSTLKFKTTDDTFKYSGVTFAATADYFHGGWFWDNSLKADLLQLNMNDYSLKYFGAAPQNVDADTWGVLSSAGYHIDLSGDGKPAAFYLEPLATLAYTWSHLSNFSDIGTATDFNLSNTFRGALGGRFGSELLNDGDTVVNASITGNYWDEFTNNTSVGLLTTAPAPVLTLNDVREKGYGEVTGQLNIADTGSGWSGYLDGGAKFNNQSTDIEFSGGIAFKW